VIKVGGVAHSLANHVNVLIFILLVSSLVSAIPVAEREKRLNAEFDYVIIGVSHSAYIYVWEHSLISEERAVQPGSRWQIGCRKTVTFMLL
jgi:hypothetical protein